MAGYKGFSMSNNAVRAYEDGEMPISKWTRQAVIDWIADDLETDSANIKLLKRYKDYLYYSGWHHTSKYYNRTEFFKVEYTLDEIQVNDQSALDRVKIREIDAKIKELEEELDSIKAVMDRWNPDAIEMLEVDINDMECNRQKYLDLIDFRTNRDIFGDTDDLHLILDDERLLRDGEFSWNGWRYTRFIPTKWVAPNEVDTFKKKLAEEYIDTIIALLKEKLDNIYKYPVECAEIEQDIRQLTEQKSSIGGVK